MTRVCIVITETTTPEGKGRIQCELEGVDRGGLEGINFCDDAFLKLPMPQRFGLVLNEALKQTDLWKMVMMKCFPPASITIGGDDGDEPPQREIQYPCRCRITDPEGEKVWEDGTHEAIALANPTVAQPKVGRTGWAHKEGPTVRIKLDDGSELMGYECWWEPIADTN